MQMGIRLISIVLCISFRLSEGTTTCTHDIPHGEITWWCGVHESCPYSCDEGYQHHDTVSWVRCNSEGKWVDDWYSSGVTEDELCTPKSCPSTIPNGKLSSDCSATVGSGCGYMCNSGYQSKAGVDTIVCQTSTNWSVDPHSLCSNNNQCPYELSNGDLELSCRRSPGETCNYACHLGYLPSTNTVPTTATCGSSLSWSQPLSSLCQNIKCPATIPNGYIPSRCTREFNSYCYYYQCDAGYQKPPGGPSLHCNASGEWDWETAAAKNLCSREEDLCPSKIKNGHIIWHCSRQAGDTCTYDCDTGCTESSTTWLRCQGDATWNVNTDNLCQCDNVTFSTTSTPSTTSTSTTLLTITAHLQSTTEINATCTHDIPHGYITWWCGIHESCPFSCDEGYQHHKKVSWVRCNSAGKWVDDWYSSGVTEDELCTPKSCPSTIPNGKLSSVCFATVGTSCGYVCDSGFQSKAGVDTIECQTSTNWSVDPHSLCSDNHQCSYEISNGDLDLSCRGSPGETCNYSCHLGYLPSNKTVPTMVTCGISLSWSQPLSSLCQKIKCPETILNGYIPSRCTRDFKSYCHDYQCDAGYQKTPGGPSLRCNASGEWEWERAAAKNLCSREEDLCPSKIKNGHIIWHCSRQAGDTCTYDCDTGCTESFTTWLRCQDDATWNVNTDDLCQCDGVTFSTNSSPLTTSTSSTLPTSTAHIQSTTERNLTCTHDIPHGEITWWCGIHESCPFSCDEGYQPHDTVSWVRCNSAGKWVDAWYTSGVTEDELCTRQSTTTPTLQCSPLIANGIISSHCSRESESYCDYSCDGGCTRTRDYLYCAKNVMWVFEAGACECRGDGESGSNLGVIVGSVVGASVLFIILVSVACWRYKRNQSRAPPTGERSLGAMNTSNPVYTITNTGQGTGVENPYHYYIDVVDSPDMQPGTCNSVIGAQSPQQRQSGQYASLQGSYNDYLTPYSALQPTSGSEPVNTVVGNDYARICDITPETPEHGYNTLNANRRLPQAPPPSYDSQDRPKDPPPSYEESQEMAAIQQSLKEL